MEIIVKGAGEVVIRFIDRKGKTLIQESIRVSGSETVEARRDVNLFAETSAGQIFVSPVLVRQGEKQQVTFGGENPSSFTKRRCQEIGCPQSVADEAEHSCVQGLHTDVIGLSSVQKPQYDFR